LQTALAVVSVFALVLASAVIADRLPVAVVGVYVVTSVIAFAAYALDKSAAQANRQRTPEKILHLLALLGGWPGALLAQQALRHKSIKVEFRRVFWATVVLNCLALALLLTPHVSRSSS
jgi:uncharacterized membrane protein YsdA (DUF1294 family)